MKKILCLTFVFILLMSGCSANGTYYSAPRDALTEVQKNELTVNDELDIISLTDDTVLYVALTTDIVRGGCVTAVVMDNKDGQYRIAKDRSAEYSKLSELNIKDVDEAGWSHFVSKDGAVHYMWQLAASNKVSEDADTGYTYKEYNFEYAGTAYELTLVLYEI